ncbi:coadhesin-like [Crassostrea virginica]
MSAEIRVSLILAALCLAGYTYAGCPSGWAGYGANCYKLFTGALEWSLAARDCQRYGANLVSIESSGEQYFVENLIGGHTAWTSGSDRNYEGAWAWYSGFQSWSYTKWHPGEPNNSGGENCLHILTSRVGWNDLPCNRGLAYVCEIHYGTSSCGSGWHQSNGRCYRMFGNTNWISALRTCQSNGANLVSIESSTEQSYVEGLIGGNSVWTSGIDGNKEGYWFFASGTRSWSYTKWHPGEPNNSGGEHCIHILTNRNGWNDLPCTHTSIYTMCEKPAPVVHGNWGAWGSYGGCTKSCASGTQSRSRSCNNPAPANGGNSCAGSSTSSQSCNTHNCPVHGNWASWSGYGSCSKTCGGGSQSRSRTCTNPAPLYGGNSCSGSGTSSQSCNTHNCPIDGNWASWASWGTCTVTCGGGTQDRSRTCTNPAPLYGGSACGGSSSSRQACNTHHCPIDGVWATWGGWGTCTETCGGGIQTRARNCSNPAPQYGGSDCPGFSSSTQTCNTHNCPIDGVWASWGSYGACTVTCGGGTQERQRTCTNPAPQYGGANCPGSTVSSQACNTQNCPIDGAWSSWGAYGTCSVTCGGGTQSRTRTCTNPTPQYGGAACPGTDTTSQDCNTQICIIDGAWGAWGTWGDCTKSCASGRKSRSRICDNPKPANGGLDCPGSSGDFEYCNTHVCPTVPAGTYQQLCPTGYFTCESGAMTCIYNAFKCDCSKDCDDGSDETEGYAGCSNVEQCLLENGAGYTSVPIGTLFLTLLTALLAKWMSL